MAAVAAAVVGVAAAAAASLWMHVFDAAPAVRSVVLGVGQPLRVVPRRAARVMNGRAAAIRAAHAASERQIAIAARHAALGHGGGARGQPHPNLQGSRSASAEGCVGG